MKNSIPTFSLLVMITLLLAGCGGGSSGGGGSSAATKWTGTKQLGVSGATTTATGIAVDSNGKVYVTGSTTGSLDGNPLSGTGSTDLFLTLYSSVGVKTSTKLLGVSGKTTIANAIAIDANNNVYIAGTTSGGLDSNTLTGTQDLFMVMYDSANNKVRTKQLGVSSKTTVATSVAVDLNGNVHVAGYTNGGLDGNTLTGTQDFFVVTYNSAGTKVRTVQLGGAASSVGFVTTATGVSVDNNGNVYVAGYTYGGLDGNTLTGTKDFFLTKYDSAGNKLFTKQLGTIGYGTQANGVAVDASGNTHVAGYTLSNLDGNTLSGVGAQDLFMTKYDTGGNKVRTKQLGVAGKISGANGVAVDANDNVYVAGSTYGGLDGNALTGVQDFFVTTYDTSGNKLRTKQLGIANKYTVANSVAVDATGNVFVAGYTTGGLDGNSLSGAQDFFITKYDSSGNKQ